MKVEELIKRLQACPLDYEVLVADFNRGYACPIYDDQEDFSICNDEKHVTLYWYEDTQF